MLFSLSKEELELWASQKEMMTGAGRCWRNWGWQLPGGEQTFLIRNLNYGTRRLDYHMIMNCIAFMCHRFGGLTERGEMFKTKGPI